MKLSKTRYQTLYRYSAGLVLLCLVVTLSGGAVNGASLFEIVYRCVLVALGSGACCWAVIKFWVAVDKMRVSNEINEDF